MLIFKIERQACPRDHYHPLDAIFSSSRLAKSFLKNHYINNYRILAAKTDVHPIVWDEVEKKG